MNRKNWLEFFDRLIALLMEFEEKDTKAILIKKGIKDAKKRKQNNLD
jgi:hypothetical protein